VSIAAYIKEIGRGKEGARSLSRAQAHDLMSQVLDGKVTDLEIGAFALSMRIKGESVEELAGFHEATQERCVPFTAPRPYVLLPSYNGSRKLPNLTPLLALLLAQEGVPVIVHGPAHDRARVTTAEIFHDLGLPAARDASEIENAWSRHEPAFMRIDALCPPLARLLDVRWVVGLRNSGHTVAKVLDPFAGAPSLRVVNYTHPEYATLLSSFVQSATANAMLMRGTEGEPVADPRRAPRLDVYLRGLLRADLSTPAHEGVLTELPVLPRDQNAAATAMYIQSVVSGEKPAPTPLLQQVDALVRALAALALPADLEKSA
jgi:anthranilate phosphoribosyltransferase